MRLSVSGDVVRSENGPVCLEGQAVVGPAGEVEFVYHFHAEFSGMGMVRPKIGPVDEGNPNGKSVYKFNAHSFEQARKRIRAAETAFDTDRAVLE